jgi:coenzyme F420-reducing hydrogenase delta subunit
MNSRETKVYVFCCSNSLDKEQLASVCSKADGVTVKTISLPCSGKIDIPYIMKAFETGADGAVLVTCKKNECQNNEGNLRAEKRAEAVESLLDEIGMGKGRMGVIELKDDAKQTLGEINNFFNKIINLPKSNLCSNTVKG